NDERGGHASRVARHGVCSKRANLELVSQNAARDVSDSPKLANQVQTPNLVRLPQRLLPCDNLRQPSARTRFSSFEPALRLLAHSETSSMFRSSGTRGERHEGLDLVARGAG